MCLVIPACSGASPWCQVNYRRLAVVVAPALVGLAGFSQTELAGEAVSPIRARIERDRPALSNPDLSEWDRVGLLRSWVYEVSDIAASEETLLRNFAAFDSLEFDPLMEILDNNRGGLWCAETADLLAKVLIEYGFYPRKVQFGIRDDVDVTHAFIVVDVKYKDQNVSTVQDAYFDNTFVDPNGAPLDYFELLRRIKAGRYEDIVVRYGDRSVAKDVLIAKTDSYSGWLSRKSGFEGLASCDALGERGYRCQLRPSLEGFIEDFESEELLDALETRGAARRFMSLLLFPYGVLKQGSYVTESSQDRTLCLARSIQQGTRAAVCSSAE